jgi:hypothetical protein
MMAVAGRWRKFGGAGGERKRASMGAGKLRVIVARAVTAGVATAGVAVLAGACGHAAPSPPAAAPTPPATPTVTPSTVPVLGPLSFGPFPSTWDGTRALALCEQWSGLRGEYVARVRAETPYQLEQWLSSDVWQAALTDGGYLRGDPAYGDISVAFGEVSTGAAASIASARFLDQSCAAAD